MTLRLKTHGIAVMTIKGQDFSFVSHLRDQTTFVVKHTQFTRSLLSVFTERLPTHLKYTTDEPDPVDPFVSYQIPVWGLE